MKSKLNFKKLFKKKKKINKMSNTKVDLSEEIDMIINKSVIKMKLEIAKLVSKHSSKVNKELDRKEMIIKRSRDRDNKKKSVKQPDYSSGS